MKEFDNPFTLLQDTSGLLYKLVHQTGKAHAETLLRVARISYEEKIRQKRKEGSVAGGAAKEGIISIDEPYDDDTKSLLLDK